MPYVSRNGGGAISGLFANPQPGYAEELLADDAAEVLAYVAANAEGGALTTERQREAARQLVELLKTPEGRALRAIVALLVNGQEAELNRVYRRFREQDIAVNTATSLADLKTKWNTLATTYPMPNRTMLQALNAVKAEITGNA